METPCLYCNAYVSLGANQGNKRGNIEKALAIINEKAGIILALSSFYESQAWGYISDETYLNVVARIETPLTPQKLLRVTQEIERTLGRTKKTVNGHYCDRPIDIDILLYEDMTMQSQELTIPHPLMHERQFVLQPLAEIAPTLVHPTTGKTIAELLHTLHAAVLAMQQ